MTVQELVSALNLSLLSGKKGLDRSIAGCYVSDLLSDVLGHAPADSIWVTLQSHKNVVAVAALKGLACVILTNGEAATEETLRMSDEEGIPLLGTSLPTFEVAGRIYDLLK